MRYLVFVMLLGGCANSPAYRAYYGEPSVVGRDGDTVQIRSGYNVDPTPAAMEACGGQARLDRTEKTDLQGYYTISYYSCA